MAPKVDRTAVAADPFEPYPGMSAGKGTPTTHPPIVPTPEPAFTGVVIVGLALILLLIRRYRLSGAPTCCGGKCGRSHHS